MGEVCSRVGLEYLQAWISRVRKEYMPSRPVKHSVGNEVTIADFFFGSRWVKGWYRFEEVAYTEECSGGVLGAGIFQKGGLGERGRLVP
jgi:hypothetical protein